MLVEANIRGKTHEEHATEGVLGRPCEDLDITLLDGCRNCDWRPDHVQERGAEIVIHYHHQDWE